MKSFRLLSFILVASIVVSLTSCSKSENIPADVEINNFVWKGLNAYYFWQDQIPDLSDTKFSSQSQLNNFLRGYDTPDNLFYSLLFDYPNTDKYSWIVSDYIALENSFAGLNESNGMEFGLVRFASTPTNLFGYVRYIVPASDAETKGVTRGMLFTHVDGVQLTETNFGSLLFSTATSYTITLANYNAGDPVATTNTITLMKTQLQENPVKIVTTFTEGANKIGYIMYNQFVAGYDDELNTAFATLKAEGITDLIVDLRYNSGGSVRSASYLGSMITGQFSGQLFSKQVWNTKVQANINPSNFVDNFSTQINNGIVSENINSLSLNTVYFIVTGSSASASELLINSLKSYIDVRLVGTTTEGKNVGSITLYDSENYGRAGANPNHTWAMQPITFETRNKDDMTVPEGFTPEVAFPEDYGNLGVLGDRNEPMLDRVITYILTGSRFSDRLVIPIYEEVTSSRHYTPTKNTMYIDLEN